MAYLQRHVVLVFDDMKIKEDLVHKKYSGAVISFVIKENVNNQLSELEETCKVEKPQHPKVPNRCLCSWPEGHSTWNFHMLISSQLTSPQIAP